MPNDLGWGAIGVAIGAFITGLFAWLTQRSKGETDHHVAVLAEWSKLTEGLSNRLSAVEQECAQLRKDHAAEIAQLRKEHAAEIEQIVKDHAAGMEALRANHRAEMRKMRELNEGLQRIIAQNSRSTAQLIGKTPVVKDEGDDE